MNHFTHCLKVRYPEVDQMGVVYHGNYIPWLEIGRSTTITNFGLTYRELEESGVLVVVTNLNVDYKIPARYDDTILVVTKLSNLEGIRISFHYEVYRLSTEIQQGSKLMSDEELQKTLKDSTLLITAETEHVCMNRDNKIIRLKRENPEVFSKFQAIHKTSQGYTE
ncbi:acyl-CoA thioesterase [Alicyclobacillus fodiniaquatilis]|uniref:Acyl-CoA thioesterase n=1 Tax=Alicyclobacillus fodiniaquatilis TaxID=1661150 RepID=A0ABW4JK94_9BACL